VAQTRAGRIDVQRGVSPAGDPFVTLTWQFVGTTAQLDEAQAVGLLLLFTEELYAAKTIAEQIAHLKSRRAEGVDIEAETIGELRRVLEDPA
jgi:hypothetical protein